VILFTFLVSTVFTVRHGKSRHLARRSIEQYRPNRGFRKKATSIEIIAFFL